MKRASRPKTPSERTAESRAAKIAQGYAQKNWLLSPAGLRALAAICRRDGVTETEAVERSLDAYSKPDAELSNEEILTLLKRRLR